MGNRASMVGGAVAATVDDGSAIWYNPGGLASTERDQVDVTGTVYALRMYSLPKMIATTQRAYQNGSVTEFVALPNSIAYVRRLGPGLSVGCGYFAPHSTNTVLRENLDARTSNPPSQWQIASAFAETQQIFAASAGMAITPKLRVGASLLGGYSTSLSSVTVFGAASSNGSTQASANVDSTATATRITAQLGLGMQLDLTPQFVLGAMLRSPELRLYSSEEAFRTSSVANLEDIDSPGLAAQSEKFRTQLPVAIRRVGRAALSLAYRYAGGSLTLEADVQPGLTNIRGERDRKMVVNARAGWYQTLNRIFAVGAGLLTDRTAQLNGNDPVSGAADCYGGTLGLELSNEHLLAPSERAKSLILSTVFASRYAYCAGDSGRIIGDPERVATQPFQVAKGSIYVHELSFYVGGGLNF